MIFLVDYPDKPIELTDANFDDNARKYPFFVVDTWTPWCPPCKMLAPVIESLAKKYVGKIVFGKLNVDEYKEIAQRYEIMGVPTLLIMKDGKLVDRIVGAIPEPLLEKKLKTFL